MYDIAIVGGGPAGLAAAVNARRRNKNTVVVAKENYSSKLMQSHMIDNYLAIPEITGKELAVKMKDHAAALGANFVKDEVQSIYLDHQEFTLLGRENSIQAKSVILSVGISLGTEIAGEAALIGQGVSYCATCDGMFFKGKAVVMIGYIPEAEAEAKFLAEVCAQVYYLPQYKIEDPLDPRITLIHGKPLTIKGSQKVEGFTTTSGEYAVDGVFIERPGRPVEQLLDGLKTEAGFIMTNTAQATNIKGVFAAGDCTGKPWQIVRATGQGQVAALSAVSYLESID